MSKKIVFAFCVYLLSFAVNAQTSDVKKALLEIERNNKELQAYTSLMESQQLELKAGNNLPDPQVGVYYLPFGNHAAGDYTEFQFTQSFEFPTVYSARNNLIAVKREQMELEYASKRQELLLPAKISILELIALNKRLRLEQERVEQAKKIVEQVQELFRNEQVGILEVNKAKIAWMQEQFTVEQTETSRENILLTLQHLNGGVKMTFDLPDFDNDLDLANIDSIWQDRQLTDPYVRILKQREEVALHQIRLSKNESLPNLTAGFNRQGVSGSYYSGVYGGISIPLWNNRHRVKSSQAKYQYLQNHSSVQTSLAYANFSKEYNDFQTLLRKFQEYQSTFNGLNSDKLLLEAYQLGEISFREYYMELQFYRQAFDSMLHMEKQLHQLQAEILKHEL